MVLVPNKLPSYNYPYSCSVGRPTLKAPPRSLFLFVIKSHKKRLPINEYEQPSQDYKTPLYW